MDVLFVASVSPIVRDADAARAFYGGALGLSFEGGEGDYVFTEQLPGVRHFGLWPLPEAARACFGRDEWPDDLPVPQASVEFEVAAWPPPPRSCNRPGTASYTAPAPSPGRR